MEIRNLYIMKCEVCKGKVVYFFFFWIVFVLDIYIGCSVDIDVKVLKDFLRNKVFS